MILINSKFRKFGYTRLFTSQHIGLVILMLTLNKYLPCGELEKPCSKSTMKTIERDSSIFFVNFMQTLHNIPKYITKTEHASPPKNEASV